MPEKRPPLTDTNDIQGLIGIGHLPSSAPVAAFNPELTESLLRTKGIRALHYKHAPNPDRETIEGGPNISTKAATKGWKYYQVRELLAIPQQARLSDTLNINGIWGMRSVLLNITGHYNDGDKSHVFCRPHDLIVFDLPGVTTEVDQLIEYNPNGPIKLNFRCESVQYLADANREYKDNIDFSVKDGKIVWMTTGKRPEFKNGKGSILSLVYYTKPVYIVQNVPHSIRITPGNSTGNGALPRDAYYAPQQLICAQSWVRVDDQDLLDFSGLTKYNGYRDSKNVTGGT